MSPKAYILLSVIIFCNSCTNSYQDLGFSQTEWEQLTQQEQQQIRKQSNDIKWKHQEQAQHNVPSKLRFREIKVKFLEGKTYFANQESTFIPVEINLSEGSCNSVKLVNQAGEKKYLNICYKNYRLDIDPSPWQIDYQNGSALIYSSELWKYGFKYTKLNTKGKTKIKNLSVFIKVI